MTGIPLTRTGPSDGGNFEYHWQGVHVEAHLLSDVGKKRKHNEDSCAFCVPEDSSLLETRGMLFVVADGMGGANAGEFASRRAIEILIDNYYHLPCNNIPACLRQAIETANARIFEESESNPEYHGMGTTLSVTAIRGDCAYVAQVGDSRVYVVRRTEDIIQVTDDHSLVAEQVRHGYLSEEEARNHSLKNLITRAVGIKDYVKVDLFSLRLRQGDTLLICSDGLSNLVTNQEIQQHLQSEGIQAAARILVGRALEEGGTDNVTAAVLRIIEDPPTAQLDQGAEHVNFANQGGFWTKLKRLIGR